jgi:hypothetical protein
MAFCRLIGGMLMGLLDSIKKINIKKIVATVQKTAQDISTVQAGLQSGGLAGGLSAAGTLSKDTPLTPTTIYGSEGAASAAGAYNAAAGTGAPAGSSVMPLVIGGLLILLLILLAKRG